MTASGLFPWGRLLPFLHELLAGALVGTAVGMLEGGAAADAGCSSDRLLPTAAVLLLPFPPAAAVGVGRPGVEGAAPSAAVSVVPLGVFWVLLLPMPSAEGDGMALAAGGVLAPWVPVAGMARMAGMAGMARMAGMAGMARMAGMPMVALA